MDDWKYPIQEVRRLTSPQLKTVRIIKFSPYFSSSLFTFNLIYLELYIDFTYREKIDTNIIEK